MIYQSEELLQHYLFVNFFLTLMYGTKLPSYCYYDSNDELHLFYNSLSSINKQQIYKYLVDNKYINSTIITERQFISNTRSLIESLCED